MEGLFAKQMDYIFFFVGLAFFTLALVTFILLKRKEKTLPWLWLGLTGIFQGIIAGLGLHNQVFGQILWESYLRMGLVLIALFCLIEFGRSGVKKLTGRGPGPWIFIPVAILIGLVWVLSGVKGTPGLNYAGRNVLGTVGGIWATLALVLVGMNEYKYRHYFYICAAAVAMYSFSSTSLVCLVPDSGSILMHKNIAFFVEIIPLPLMKGLSAFVALLALVMWQIQEKKLRDTTVALGEGVYHVDRQGYITFVNPAAQRILGWAEEELLGKHLSEVISRRYPDGTPIDREDTVLNKVSVRGEAFCSEGDYFIRKDGTVFPVSCVISHFVEDGQVTGMVTAFQDITERQKREEDQSLGQD